MTRLLTLVVCSVALLVAGCGERSAPSSAERAPTNAAKNDGLPELMSMAQLQRAFDAHPGVPRLLILLSPT
jgi:hypothetical protein